MNLSATPKLYLTPFQRNRDYIFALDINYQFLKRVLLNSGFFMQLSDISENFPFECRVTGFIAKLLDILQKNVEMSNICKIVGKSLR